MPREGTAAATAPDSSAGIRVQDKESDGRVANMERYNSRRTESDVSMDWVEHSLIAARNPYIREFYAARKLLDAALAAIDEENASRSGSMRWTRRSQTTRDYSRTS